MCRWMCSEWPMWLWYCALTTPPPTTTITTATTTTALLLQLPLPVLLWFTYKSILSRCWEFPSKHKTCSVTKYMYIQLQSGNQWVKNIVFWIDMPSCFSHLLRKAESVNDKTLAWSNQGTPLLGLKHRRVIRTTALCRMWWRMHTLTWICRQHDWCC